MIHLGLEILQFFLLIKFKKGIQAIQIFNWISLSEYVCFFFYFQYLDYFSVFFIHFFHWVLPFLCDIHVELYSNKISKQISHMTKTLSLFRIEIFFIWTKANLPQKEMFAYSEFKLYVRVFCVRTHACLYVQVGVI